MQPLNACSTRSHQYTSGFKQEISKSKSQSGLSLDGSKWHPLWVRNGSNYPSCDEPRVTTSGSRIPRAFMSSKYSSQRVATMQLHSCWMVHIVLHRCRIHVACCASYSCRMCSSINRAGRVAAPSQSAFHDRQKWNDLWWCGLVPCPERPGCWWFVCIFLVCFQEKCAFDDIISSGNINSIYRTCTITHLYWRVSGSGMLLKDQRILDASWCNVKKKKRKYKEGSHCISCSGPRPSAMEGLLTYVDVAYAAMANPRTCIKKQSNYTSTTTKHCGGGRKSMYQETLYSSGPVTRTSYQDT